MDISVIQILLGICLFFITNWIGKHSLSIGYMEITVFLKTDEAPAFNFFVRVLTPVVYIIITSTILYYYCLDRYVSNIYMVNIYYIAFRLLFNLFTNRVLLLNWYRNFLNWGAIIVISYYAYDKLIKVKQNILPDFTTFANELWIIIIVFVFQVVNNVKLSQDGNINRRQKYLKSRYKYFKKLYGKKIKEITQNELLEVIAYAVLIYEDFNRPRIVRIIENIRFKITKKPHTLGVMQVASDKLLSDRQSVILGTTKIVQTYNSLTVENRQEEEEYGEWSLMNKIIGDYNTGQSYSYEVTEMAQTLRDEFYKNTKDRLLRK